MAGQRALILVRLSRVTDATTSPERQLEACHRYCDAHDMTVVGVAEDLDVSGSTDPVERTGSGPWLRERLAEFDVVVSAKLDRVGRSARHISALMTYLVDHGKSLATVADSLDISTPMGRMIVYILATLGEMELASMSERNTGAAQYNLSAGKYRGGVAPAGFMAVRDTAEGAKGWRLVPDEDGTAPVVREVFKRVLDGDRVSAIVADLNARGVQTPKDRQAELTGRKPTGRGWTVSNLRRMLASPTAIGRVTHRPVETYANGKPRKINGQKVYGAERLLLVNGEPLVRAEPLIEPADWYRVQKILADRRLSTPRQTRPVESPLLAGVLWCGHCSEPMWKIRGGLNKATGRRRADRYRCASTQRQADNACGSGSVTLDAADGFAESVLMMLLGDVEHAEREYAPGNSNAAVIEQLDAEIASYTEAIGRLRAGSPALTSVLDAIESRETRRAELAAEPETDAGYRYVPTGKMFAEHWATLSVTERNDYLRGNGVRIEYTRLPGQEPRQHFDAGDLPAMIAAVTGEKPHDLGDALQTITDYRLTRMMREQYPAEYYGGSSES